MATLADRLRDWARDDTHNKAAVELLIAHDFWLHQKDFIKAAVDQDPDFARIYWHRAEDFAQTTATASNPMLAVLRMAALIGGDTARLATLDRANRELVVKALADALAVKEISRG